MESLFAYIYGNPTVCIYIYIYRIKLYTVEMLEVRCEKTT